MRSVSAEPSRVSKAYASDSRARSTGVSPEAPKASRRRPTEHMTGSTIELDRYSTPDEQTDEAKELPPIAQRPAAWQR